TTKDFDRTFFTVTSPTENLSRLSSLLFTQTVTQCSTRWDLCVTVTHHNAGLASLSRVVMVLLCLFLYFIWVSLTLFSLRLYEDRLSLERTLV
ncbi:cyclic diguanylate phosphodiesterase, partial [Escherichia coli]|nr:cyclic diguanylate phosphodiesterase [Escherichia coli]